MATAILYGKPECHLCEDAAAILESLAREGALHWRRVDIREDPVVFERFRYLIPVIQIEGGPTLEWPTTRERVRRALAAAEAGPVNRAPDLVRASWLAAANLAVAIFVGLPLLAPVLLAYGFADPATAIYGAYRLVCHQWAFRSYFLFGAQPTYAFGDLVQLVGHDQVHGFLGSPELGYKVGFCERDVAIYLAVLLAGLLYARLRGRARPLGLVAYATLILPMALDGFTQLFGWRESTVELRTLTGALFGLASVWLVYPRVDAALAPGRSRDRVVEAVA